MPLPDRLFKLFYTLPHYVVTAQKKAGKNAKSGEETKTLSQFSKSDIRYWSDVSSAKVIRGTASPIYQGVVCKDAVMAVEEVFSRCRRPTKRLHLRRLGISISASLQMDGRLPWRDRGNRLRSDNSSTPFFGRQRPKGPLKAT